MAKVILFLFFMWSLLSIQTLRNFGPFSLSQSFTIVFNHFVISHSLIQIKTDWTLFCLWSLSAFPILFVVTTLRCIIILFVLHDAMKLLLLVYNKTQKYFAWIGICFYLILFLTFILFILNFLLLFPKVSIFLHNLLFF